ncbi:7548_t:CDS:2 [Entrophospora sp. SA101]|nr:7548_t:CDS:2 [Entrophospora sp. SA101]CAJ0845167.1 13566_t:CDS:2 [Entrophospora sp. SA101]
MEQLKWPKKFDATKLLTDGFKLTKAMHDIIVYLSEQAHFEETKS